VGIHADRVAVVRDRSVSRYAGGPIALAWLLIVGGVLGNVLGNVRGRVWAKVWRLVTCAAIRASMDDARIRAHDRTRA
jgi:hypothetical protein